MKTRFFYFTLCACLLTSIVAGLAKTSVLKVSSPDRQLSAYSESEKVRVVSKTFGAHIAWTFTRTVDLNWSTDSKYLFVTDYVTAEKNAVLIFAFSTKAKPYLIYQTPYSDSVNDHFYFNSYRTGKETASIRHEKESGATENLTVDLNGRAKINQTIYPSLR